MKKWTACLLAIATIPFAAAGFLYQWTAFAFLAGRELGEYHARD
jgi:hypothetical protein